MPNPLTRKEDVKITIPESIILASNLNVKKPIFLYNDKHFFFSNKKHKNLECYGEIHLDSNYSFIASENILKLFGDIDYLHYYTEKGILYIRTTCNYYPYYNGTPKDYKVQIPCELANTKSINFNKPVYMYHYSYSFGMRNCLYLSNESFYLNPHMCLGKITLDSENYFTFPATAYYFRDVRNNSFCISTDNTDKNFIYKLLGSKRIMLTD